ncbi:MAG: 2Fe-2S iron-sulfur cluster binding domain-containing protein [Colwellia sp.]|nr:2Fe-2S iron-sulfur cluster binding domain-containing protein [Colwellia sp.]
MFKINGLICCFIWFLDTGTTVALVTVAITLNNPEWSGSMTKKQLHRIEVVNRNQVFYCAEDQLLLIGMERQNINCINVGCRGGGCGVCKVRIITGDYETKCMSRAHISEAEEKQNYALACRVLPRGDLLIEYDQE